VGFFDHRLRLPVPERVPPRPPRVLPEWIKPEAELPGVVPSMLMLARNDDIAVAVGELRAYRHGFEFTLTTVLRLMESHADNPWLLDWRNLPADVAEVPDEFFRVGLAYADGVVITNLDRNFWAWDERPTRPYMQPGSGGGGSRRFDMTYWVWPLPPPGPLTFVCQWPARNIPESQAQIDARLILNASSQAIDVWPGQPSTIHQPYSVAQRHDG
jgi:hypothetical protein